MKKRKKGIGRGGKREDIEIREYGKVERRKGKEERNRKMQKERRKRNE